MKEKIFEILEMISTIEMVVGDQFYSGLLVRLNVQLVNPVVFILHLDGIIRQRRAVYFENLRLAAGTLKP